LPDETPKLPKPLPKRGQIILPTHDERVVGFFSVEGVGGGLEATGFDVAEEVEHTVRLVRSADPKDSAAGLRHLRNIMRDVARANGMLGQIQETVTETDEDGREVKRSISTTHLLNRLRNKRDREDHEYPVTQYEPESGTSGEPAAGADGSRSLASGSEAADAVRIPGSSSALHGEADPVRRTVEERVVLEQPPPSPVREHGGTDCGEVDGGVESDGLGNDPFGDSDDLFGGPDGE